MKSNISVSVIIPAYNAAAWLDDTLQSVLAQTGVELEVVVVDDGSIDDTRAVVEKYSLVRYLYKTNGGQASARNFGIKNTKGDYIAFLDADDIWLPGKLSAQIKLMHEGNWAWCYCDGVAFSGSPDRNLYTFSKVQPMHQGDVLEPLLLGNFIPSPSPVVLRSVFDQIGLFNEDREIRNREDWEMWLRIADRHALGYTPGRYFGYRHHEANGTRIENHESALASKLRVISEAVARNPVRLELLSSQARVNQALNSAKAALKFKQRIVARKIARDIIATKPLNGSAYILWLFSFVDSKVLGKIANIRHILRK